MEFTNNWFTPHKETWNHIVPQYDPRIIVEVGSYEGQSACFLIQLLGNLHPLEIYCIDTWLGGQEHARIDMAVVEDRFERNIGECVASVAHNVSVTKVKSASDYALAHFLAQGKANQIDMIYIDGSHEAPDVLVDAVLGFKLLRVGGLMVFDDYLWGQGPTSDPITNPKLAIDGFLNCYQRKIQCHPWIPLAQLYCRKLQN